MDDVNHKPVPLEAVRYRPGLIQTDEHNPEFIGQPAPQFSRKQLRTTDRDTVQELTDGGLAGELKLHEDAQQRETVGFG